jgi:hypothetical protein
LLLLLLLSFSSSFLALPSLLTPISLQPTVQFRIMFWTNCQRCLVSVSAAANVTADKSAGTSLSVRIIAWLLIHQSELETRTWITVTSAQSCRVPCKWPQKEFREKNTEPQKFDRADTAIGTELCADLAENIQSYYEPFCPFPARCVSVDTVNRLWAGWPRTPFGSRQRHRSVISVLIIVLTWTGARPSMGVLCTGITRPEPEIHLSYWRD